MKTKNTRKQMQIFHLSEEEKRDPKSVLRSFADDISLAEVRALITQMRDLCTTTSNVTYGDPKAREDLFFVTQKILRFFEASYLQINNPTFQLTMHAHAHQSRMLRILEKEFFGKSPGGGHIVPSLQLYGKWMAEVGFTPGKEVQVISEPNYIFITPAEEWQKITAAVQKIRA